jgi:hypothetical protein
MGGAVTQTAAIGRFELDLAQRGGEQAMTVGAAERVMGTGQRKTGRAVIELSLAKGDFRVVADRAVVTEGSFVGIGMTS